MIPAVDRSFRPFLWGVALRLVCGEPHLIVLTSVATTFRAPFVHDVQMAARSFRWHDFELIPPAVSRSSHCTVNSPADVQVPMAMFAFRTPLDGRTRLRFHQAESMALAPYCGSVLLPNHLPQLLEGSIHHGEKINF